MTSQAILQENEGPASFCRTIGEDITTIKSKEDIWRFIESKFHDLPGFKCCTIFLYNRERTVLEDFLADVKKTASREPFYPSVHLNDNEKDLPVNDISFLSIVEKDKGENFAEKTVWINPAPTGGISDPILFPLKDGEKILGYWVVYFRENKIADQRTKEMLETASYQISLLVSKVITGELLLEQEGEREIIQSLNADFAMIKDKKDLLKVIHFKLKRLFEFDHQWVAVINDDQLTMTSFLQEPQFSAKEHPKYLQVTKARYPTNDNFFNKTLLSRDVMVFDLVQCASRQALPEYLQILRESGVDKVAMVGLHVGDKMIGVWAICLATDQQLDVRQLNLIKGISIQISIAVDNIIAYEAIKYKEAEREQLLKLSFDISNVRTRDDLIKVINSNVRKLFPFENINLLILDEDPLYNSYILASPGPTLIQPPDQAELSDPEQTYRINKAFEMMLKFDGILILDMDNFSSSEYCTPYLKYEYQHGIKEKITLALRDEDRILGMLCVNTKDRGIYSEHSLELIKGVSYQLSSAVSNILANEHILRREEERELLLSISTDIAAVRSKMELLKVINKRFKTVLGFIHTVIGTVTNEHVIFTPPQLHPAAKNKAPKLNDEPEESAKYEIGDCLLHAAVDSDKPVVINLAELSRKAELPLCLKVVLETGIKQAVVARFSKEDNIYGFLILLYENAHQVGKNKLNLIQSLANHAAVAVLNIHANEEINKREDEKSRLLAFSNALATVRDKNTLAKSLKHQLKDLFGISDYVIHMLNEDKSKHTPILFDPEGEFSQQLQSMKLHGVQSDINDSIFNLILCSVEPVILNVDEWPGMKGDPDGKPVHSAGRKDKIGVAIKFQNENIGLLIFKHDDQGLIGQNDSLFKSILSQIAVMVSNIIANEKINNQIAEINNYKQLLEDEKTYLQEEIETAHNYAEIIGDSPQMQKVFRLIAQVAHSDSSVLLLGETGTGKELVARAIHNNSPRKNKLMVKVNCAALPANLIESELFGHERGSFTGATERRLGKFELANGGTLFLDEIGEMPLDLQVKLLRALQEREIERIGGKGIIKVDVRIVAATNRDLEKEMEEGRFRRDLYYRLNIFPITLPPLRNRKEDIPLLAAYFINRFAKKAGRKIKTISKRALQDMVMYNWPGNIRELEHLMERSILLSEGDMLKTVHLPAQKDKEIIKPAILQFQIRTIDDNEREHILETLKYCQGRVGGYSGAAELLGVPPSTLFSKMKKLGIKRDVISDKTAGQQFQVP